MAAPAILSLLGPIIQKIAGGAAAGGAAGGGGGMTAVGGGAGGGAMGPPAGLLGGGGGEMGPPAELAGPAGGVSDWDLMMQKLMASGKKGRMTDAGLAFGKAPDMSNHATLGGLLGTMSQMPIKKGQMKEPPVEILFSLLGGRNGPTR